MMGFLFFFPCLYLFLFFCEGNEIPNDTIPLHHQYYSLRSNQSF